MDDDTHTLYICGRCNRSFTIHSIFGEPTQCPYGPSCAERSEPKLNPAKVDEFFSGGHAQRLALQ